MTNSELAVDKLFSDWIAADAIATGLFSKAGERAAPRCELHDTRLDLSCERCGEKVCGECSGASGVSLCGACDELAYQHERSKRASRANLAGIVAGAAIFIVAVAVFLLR